MEAKGITIATTIFLMAMVITVNSVPDHEAPIIHDEGKIPLYDCYKSCTLPCFSKPEIHKCLFNCHLKCNGYKVDNFMHYCNVGCSITHCSKFGKDAEEDCKKTCSKHCEIKA